MYDLNAFVSLLDGYAPLELSRKMIEKGDYDNSGLLVKCSSAVNKVLFTLDLTETAVKRAVRLGCDTVVTHHPAIYSPLKSLSDTDLLSSAVLNAVKRGINVISMHLNLDVADGGIDACLCQGLGGLSFKILEMLDEKHGYGREFSVAPVTLKDYLAKAKKTFGTNKIITYGKSNAVIKKVASFCGGGASHAEKCVINNTAQADLIVTSDMAHHVIKEILDSGKCVMIIPHYASEEYGFKKYYERVKATIGSEVPTYYFDDKRFR